MKPTVLLVCGLVLASCGGSSGSDPVYLALRANPPTSIPAKHLPKLRRGLVSCDVFKQGQAGQYMTCWWPNGSGTVAYLSYYGGGLQRPDPRKIIAPGGKAVTGYLNIK